MTLKTAKMMNYFSSTLEQQFGWLLHHRSLWLFLICQLLQLRKLCGSACFVHTVKLCLHIVNKYACTGDAGL